MPPGRVRTTPVAVGPVPSPPSSPSATRGTGRGPSTAHEGPTRLREGPRARAHPRVGWGRRGPATGPPALVVRGRRGRGPVPCSVGADGASRGRSLGKASEFPGWRRRQPRRPLRSREGHAAGGLLGPRCPAGVAGDGMGSTRTGGLGGGLSRAAGPRGRIAPGRSSCYDNSVHRGDPMDAGLRCPDREPLHDTGGPPGPRQLRGRPIGAGSHPAVGRGGDGSLGIRTPYRARIIRSSNLVRSTIERILFCVVTSSSILRSLGRRCRRLTAPGARGGTPTWAHKKTAGRGAEAGHGAEPQRTGPGRAGVAAPPGAGHPIGPPEGKGPGRRKDRGTALAPPWWF